MIKKIIFSDLSTSLNYLAIGGIRFYDKQNTIIPSGNMINNTSLSGETDNFLFLNNATPYNLTQYSLVYALLSTKSQTGVATDSCYFLTSIKTSVNLTIIFKEPIPNLTKIEFNPRPDNLTERGITGNFSIFVYDEFDDLIATYPIIPLTTNNTVQILETPDLTEKTKCLIDTIDSIYSIYDNQLLILDKQSITEDLIVDYGCNDYNLFNNSYSTILRTPKVEPFENGYKLSTTVELNKYSINQLSTNAGYSFIAYNNIYYTIIDNQLSDIGTTEPSVADFVNSGITDLSSIDLNLLDNFSIINIITYTESDSPYAVELAVNPFNPMTILNSYDEIELFYHTDRSKLISKIDYMNLIDDTDGKVFSIQISEIHHINNIIVEEV